MSDLIISIENLFDNLFKDVTTSFVGNYHNNNPEVGKIIEELYNDDIPTSRNDRINLKNDGSNVVSDYKKALELKKQEI